MSNFKINRRSFITSTGAIFTLPLLESLFPLSRAMAAGANDPKRFVSFYFPSGTYNLPDKPIWAMPAGTLNSGNLSLALSPFASNASEIIGMNNLKLDVNVDLPEDHSQQAAAYLTGAKNRTASMISFDQIIADKTGKGALSFGGGITNGESFTEQWGISYRDNKVIIGISNPGDMYRKLLSQVVPSAGTSVNTPVQVDSSRSILDASLADFTAFNATLSKTDKAKMDEFMTAVRTLEGRVAPAAGSGGSTVVLAGACAKPTLNSSLDNGDSDPLQYVPKFFAFNDLIKIAFACDVSRSVTIMVDQEATHRNFAPAGGYVYKGADINGLGDAHLEISHACNEELGYNRSVTAGRVYMSMVNDLVEKLKSAADPSGSRILDNTIIQAGYGVNDGSHNVFNEQRPLVLMGGRNMLSGGNSYAFSGTTSNFRDMYYTFASKMGLGLNNFMGSSTLLKL
jgi:hypothetical protein